MANPVLSVLGEPVEILVTSQSSGYRLCVGVQTSPPGGGPPPHMHQREDELFTVLEGEFEFFDGQAWGRVGPGDIRWSSRGTYHAFRNVGSAPGRMMFSTNGGGLDEYFALISHLVLPGDFDRLVEISSHYGYIFKPQDDAG